jgi:hypothetical protein
MIFDTKSFVASAKAQNYEWLIKIGNQTYDERQKSVLALQGEIQTLLDYIVKLKKVEDKMLTRLGFPDRGKGNFRTLPEFSQSERSSAPLRLSTLDYIGNTKSGKEALLNFNQQNVNLGLAESLLRVRNEDRNIRRLNYKILRARLEATMKMELLKSLNKEKTAVEKG